MSRPPLLRSEREHFWTLVGDTLDLVPEAAAARAAAAWLNADLEDSRKREDALRDAGDAVCDALSRHPEVQQCGACETRIRAWRELPPVRKD